MSRSKKKSPCIKPCGGSNSKGKKYCNRIFRRKSKEKILQNKEPLYDLNEAINEWDLGCDGLARYIKNLDNKYLRK